MARYADEDTLFPDGEPFPNGYRYRDWVIQAFNDDMPYDLFVKAQIAGDLLEKSAGRPLRAGLGLFALGPWYYKIIEPPKARADERHDRVDVLTRGFLGLTVACARCHDHKYDPIPTKDYYALSGVFANTEAKEYPLAETAVVKAYDEQKKKISDQEERIKKALEKERTLLEEEWAKKVSAYLLAGAAGRFVRPGQGDCRTISEVPRLAGEISSVPGRLGPLAIVRRRRGPAPSGGGTFSGAGNCRRRTRKTRSRNTISACWRKPRNPKTRTTSSARAATSSPARMERDKFVLWTDLFGAKQRTLEDDPGVFYYDDKHIDRFLAGETKTRIDGMRAELKS